MKHKLLLLAVTLLGLSVRLYNFTAISLWHDEAFSALLIKYSWTEMLYRIGLDVHPPLYYIMLRFWHYIFGDSLASLRGMSVFFGVLCIPMVYALVTKAFKNRTAAIWAALLVAVNPFFVSYVTEARMYTFGAFVTLAAAWALVTALEKQTIDESVTREYLPYYGLFALLASAMMYTHYYLFFTLAAFGFYALYHLFANYRLQVSGYKWFLSSVVVTALLYIPWLKTFLFQLKQVEGGYWIPPIDRWSIPSTLWQMFTGNPIDTGEKKAVVIAVFAVVLAFVILWQLFKSQVVKEKILIILAMLAPFAGSILFFFIAKLQGKETSVFLVRYFVFTTPFFAIAIAAWLAEAKKITLAKAVIILYSLSCLWWYWGYWQDLHVEAKPGMTAAVQYLKTRLSSNDKIFIGSSFEYFNFKYYIGCNPPPSLQTGPCPLLYTGGTTTVSSLPHYAGTAILTDSDLLPDFNARVKPSDTVWLIWTNGFGGNKPNVPQTWLEIDEKQYPEVRPYVGTTIYLDQYRVQ